MNKLQSGSQNDFAVNLQLLHLGCEQLSSWMNLGYWESEDLDYPDACRALAIKLGELAQIQTDQSILDVGCGCGEQLRVWRDRFQCGRIYGIDPSQTHISRARDLTKGMQNITLEEASSATYRGNEERYDHVLSLDSVYHFPKRRQFFRRAFQSLNDGCSLSFSDLIINDRAKRNSKIRDLCAALCGIPPENLISAELYRSELEEIGFTDIKIDFIDDAVFSGFANFVDRIGRDFRSQVLQFDWLKIWITARACRILRRNGTVHYAMIRARKMP
ncbi:MAG: class I SAM-dependent methyltransferase [Planctomycetota bacterium]|nr:class I SAM-dependent methyltransferase [Planctomycetota bacterium]